MAHASAVNGTTGVDALVSRVLGETRAAFVRAVVHIDPALAIPASGTVTPAELAMALGAVLFEGLTTRVPDARAYAEEALAEGRRIVLDHGALRTVGLEPLAMGGLPRGHHAFTRVLVPLGYHEVGLYPLERLRMIGRAFAHRDAPETVPQYFVSDLDPTSFSPAFEGAARRVVGTSRDPLDAPALARLETLAEAHVLPFEDAALLLDALVRCFARHHDEPSLADYEILRAESPEMAWIATEGNAFNHATDRVADVAATAARERDRGRRVKAAIEIGSEGRVRQTAFFAASVERGFMAPEGRVVRTVPGSFFEFITRDPLPTGPLGAARLDLAFDVRNATGIFGMTRTHEAPAAEADELVRRLGLPASSGEVVGRSPIDGSQLYAVRATDAAALERALARLDAGFAHFRVVPAPKRASILRAFATRVRGSLDVLASLITLEVGKIPSEARGEVQEVIDICDFAVGLSRQLHGLAIASERPEHRLMETWHPLGPVAIITAFNFPMAVFAWNAALALVCGDPVLWKPSEKTPLCTEALFGLLEDAASESGFDPSALIARVHGGADVGEPLVRDPRVKLVSATGSTRMGRAVATLCAPTFKRTLLELGGNNAAIVMPSADLEAALRAITFSGVGTAGQRCTTMRRLFVHTHVADALVERLKAAYASLPIGDPREDGVLVGPLIDDAAGAAMAAALDEARALGAAVHGGERVVVAGREGGVYVRPALVEMPAQTGPMLRETFAPILYIVRIGTLDEGLTLNAASTHGLSSSLFTMDLREMERFLGPAGSDCGIANVNVGTSGAEIGGAFGGEKDTGGGRESGSDAWKAYMRRATNTIGYGEDLPLAQGVRFDVPTGGDNRA